MVKFNGYPRINKALRFTELSNKAYRLEKGARKFVDGIGKGDVLLPIILLEAAVTAGRTYHAFDRGGFVEGRERFTEETLGAILWLGGVSAFNKMGDFIGKKILKLKNVDFDAVEDNIRKPLKNYMKQAKEYAGEFVKNGAKAPIYNKKALAIFKFAKVASSILATNAIIGFVLPKMNQAMTVKYQNSIEELNVKNPKNYTSVESLDAFKNKLKKEEKTDKNEKLSFKGLFGVSSLLSTASKFEHDARYKLLSTDVGVAGGRAINARNKHERREVLFRDLSSIYFYMFCRSHLNSLLNLIEDGRTQRLGTDNLKKLDSHLRHKLFAGEKPQNSSDKMVFDLNKKFTSEEFAAKVLGNADNIPKEVMNESKELFDNGVITLKKFEKFANNDADLIARARKMSKIQPQVEGVSILTTEQVKDLYRNGLIDDPGFLYKLFRRHTNGKSTNPTSYVKDSDLRNVKQQVVDYVKDIAKAAKSKGEHITVETLKKASKSNIIKNTFNLGAGFAVSAYFLSSAIPKIQYWITKAQTGNGHFPGVEHYND